MHIYKYQENRLWQREHKQHNYMHRKEFSIADDENGHDKHAATSMSYASRRLR